MKCNWAWLIALVLTLSMMACEDENYDFGDPNLASDFQIVSITDSVSGYDFDFVNPQPKDTTYIYHYLQRDTVYNPDGSVGEVNVDTVYYEGKTAKLYEVPVLLLPSYKNRLYIRVKSNARWNAPVIPFPKGHDWIKNDQVAGIGDAIIDYKVGSRMYGLEQYFPEDFLIPVRRRIETQYITTRDSMVMYKLQFEQKSMTEE
ncbi:MULTISPECIES: hypothetical protein [unclassified Carboxylicivirga]|uniref:hypothetical protein n=1 Tax=Carboxylicivirga TaxID=1628153 RepID=UPI003D342C1E